MKSSIILLLFLVGCKSVESLSSNNKDLLKNNYIKGNSFALYQGINDTSFVKLKSFSSDFVLDMKYATNDNFLKTAVYDCDECYLRLKTIKNLIAANDEFRTLGLRIKLFDCYRPLDVQKKMFALVSNPDFVANPKKGSIHNRGGAVDITLIDADGKELDMGTTFDFFGPEASHNYQGFSRKIRKNRALLKNVMLKHHFRSFDSEWWHYNLTDSSNDSLANFKWKCN
jgi:D-alanyl-D-alanine dipeptidase